VKAHVYNIKIDVENGTSADTSALFGEIFEECSAELELQLTQQQLDEFKPKGKGI